MSDVVASSSSLAGAVHPPAISARDIWPWALFVLALLVLLYTVGVEQGATSLTSGNFRATTRFPRSSSPRPAAVPGRTRVGAWVGDRRRRTSY